MASENKVSTDAPGGPGTMSLIAVGKNPKCWMENRIDSTPIRDLVLFGSHNSCDKDHQKLSTLNQLKNGGRFLDLHLTVYKGTVCVFSVEGHIPFLDVLGEIQTFLQCFQTETVIVYLQDSKLGGGLDWAGIKGIIAEPIKAMFVAKGNLDMQLKHTRGSIILFAPEALDMEINWGSSLIETHLAPADANTRAKLNEFLESLIGKLSKDKLVWVEIRLRGDKDQIKDYELMEACDFFIPHGKGFNILSFSLVDKTHFKDLQHRLLKL